MGEAGWGVGTESLSGQGGVESSYVGEILGGEFSLPLGFPHSPGVWGGGAGGLHERGLYRGPHPGVTPPPGMLGPCLEW